MIPDQMNQHITVDAMGQLVSTSMIIPTDFSIPPPNTVPWLARPNFVNQQFQPMSLEVSFSLNFIRYDLILNFLSLFQGSFHQSASSPMLSQPSSPAHSRTASPTRSGRNIDDNSSRSSTTGGSSSQTSERGSTGGNRQQQQGQGNTRGTVKTSRRPSIDSTPPPQQTAQSQIITVVAGNEMIIPANLKGDFNEVSFDF